MSSISDPIILPIATIQHDFLSVISDADAGLVEGEDVWLSCYKADSPSIHGKVRVTLGETSRKVVLQSRDGVELIKSADTAGYAAACPSLGIPPTTLKVPWYGVEDEVSTNKPKQLSAIAIAPDLQQLAVGYEDGTIRRLPISLPSSQGSRATGNATESLITPTTTTYTPHLSGTGITALRYFPSSKVILSSGTDFTLHVLDADPSLSPSPISKPARSLRGHARSITDIAIIEKGKNVLSCGRDGTIRLWDVGSATQIRMMGSQNYSAINKMVLGTSPRTNEDAAIFDEREVGTADKLAFVALQSGEVEAFDLSSKASIFRSNTNSGPLVAVDYDSPSSLLATGAANGIVTIYDVRFLSGSLCSFRRNTASITGLRFNGSAEPRLAIATADGLPFIAGIRPNGPEVVAELVAGGDCEPNRVLEVDSAGNVWVGGDENVLRVY